MSAYDGGLRLLGVGRKQESNAVGILQYAEAGCAAQLQLPDKARREAATCLDAATCHGMRVLEQRRRRRSSPCRSMLLRLRDRSWVCVLLRGRLAVAVCSRLAGLMF